MASLSDMQARREKLAAAIDSGALSIRHGEKTITYRSQTEMERALYRLDKDIAVAAGAKKPTKQLRIYTRRAT